MKCGNVASTTDPKVNDADWVCGECGEKRKGKECINSIETLQSKLELMKDEDNIGKDNVVQYEKANIFKPPGTKSQKQICRYSGGKVNGRSYLRTLSYFWMFVITSFAQSINTKGIIVFQREIIFRLKKNSNKRIRNL